MISINPIPLEKGLSDAIGLARKGDLVSTRAMLLPLTRVYGLSGKLWGYLGFVNRELGDEGEAVRCFRRASRLSPNSEMASLGLFHGLWRSGQQEEAIAEMRRFVRTGRADQYVELIRDMLRPPVEGRRRGNERPMRGARRSSRVVHA